MIEHRTSDATAHLLAGAIFPVLKISGSTLIVGDLHLCSFRTDDDNHITLWLRELLRAAAPSTLVFAGDTFELSFLCPEARNGSPTALSELIRVHHDLVRVLCEQDSLQQIIFIRGDHDHVLCPAMLPTLEAALPRAKVYFADAVLETISRSYITHGNQLDYNLTTVYVDGSTLTDRLTQLFETYLFATPGAKNDLMTDVTNGTFSFWYATGRLPHYLHLTESVFQYRRSTYVNGLWQLLRSEFFSTWRNNLPKGFNRTMAAVLRSLAQLPSWAVWWMSPLWFHLCSHIFRQRALSVLRGDTHCLLNVPLGANPQHLVLSHAHEAGHFRTVQNNETKSAYVVTTPRWHISRERPRQLELCRESSVVLISGTGQVSHLLHCEQKFVPRRHKW